MSKIGRNESLFAVKKVEIIEAFLRKHDKKDNKDKQSADLLLRAHRFLKKELEKIYGK